MIGDLLLIGRAVRLDGEMRRLRETLKVKIFRGSTTQGTFQACNKVLDGD